MKFLDFRSVWVSRGVFSALLRLGRILSKIFQGLCEAKVVEMGLPVAKLGYVWYRSWDGERAAWVPGDNLDFRIPKLFEIYHLPDLGGV